MKRRRLLASLAAGPALTGCLSSRATPGERKTTPGDDPSTPDDDTTTPGPSCPADPDREVTVVGTAALPSRLELSMSATLTRTNTTASAPATLELELTNEGDRRDVKPHGQMCDPFNRWLGHSEPRGLWLYEASEGPDERVGQCWTIPDGSPRAFPAYACMSETMDPAATRTWTYELWDDAASEGYYPTGEYRFTTEVSVEEEVETAGEWWLDIRVSNPDA